MKWKKLPADIKTENCQLRRYDFVRFSLYREKETKAESNADLMPISQDYYLI